MKEMWRISQFFPNILPFTVPIRECKLLCKRGNFCFYGMIFDREFTNTCWPGAGGWVAHGICLFKALAEVELVLLLIPTEKSFEALSTS